jgi:hypothetical protein
MGTAGRACLLLPSVSPSQACGSGDPGAGAQSGSGGGRVRIGGISEAAQPAQPDAAGAPATASPSHAPPCAATCQPQCDSTDSSQPQPYRHRLEPLLPCPVAGPQSLWCVLCLEAWWTQSCAMQHHLAGHAALTVTVRPPVAANTDCIIACCTIVLSVCRRTVWASLRLPAVKLVRACAGWCLPGAVQPLPV